MKIQTHCTENRRAPQQNDDPNFVPVIIKASVFGAVIWAIVVGLYFWTR